MNKKDIQNNKNLEDKVLDKISNEKIKPKSKLEFLLQNIYFWILVAVTIILGSLFISAGIFVMRNIRWELYNATHDSLFMFMLSFIPFLWTILFIIFLVYSYYLVRKTKHGYRYHILIVSTAVILISLILGTIFSSFGVGERLDGGFGYRIPFHAGLERHSALLWNNREEGRLIGVVSLIEDKFVLTNYEGEQINLIVDDIDKRVLEVSDLDNPIRIIGLDKDDDFYVCGIFPGIKDSREVMEIKKEIFERKIIIERNKECEGVRPYQRLLEK